MNYDQLAARLDAEEEKLGDVDFTAVRAVVHPQLRPTLAAITDRQGRPVLAESCHCKGPEHSLCGYVIDWDLGCNDTDDRPSVALKAA